jgi:hypothetical protein
MRIPQEGHHYRSMDLDRLSLSRDRYEPAKQELMEEIRTIPEVESAASASHIPLDGSSWTLGVHVEGAEGSSKFTWVSPSYFQTMQIPLITGRDFNARDTATSQAVAIDQRGGARLAPQDPWRSRSEPALGRRFGAGRSPPIPTHFTIVGVTKDTKYGDLRETIPPTSFVPTLAAPKSGPISIRDHTFIGPVAA